MILIALDEDQESISHRFRKAPYFAFVKGKEIHIQKNPLKRSKSHEFFEYFKTIKIDSVYLKALGYQTYLKLEALGVAVYFIQKSHTYHDITEDDLLRIDASNAQTLCTLGHHTK